MRTKRIGLDFDGVIENVGEFKVAAAKRYHGFEIDPADFRKEVLVARGHFTAEGYKAFQRRMYTDTELGRLMEPVAGMHETLARLLEDGHELSIITSRDPVEEEIARAWCEHQGIRIPLVADGVGKSKATAAQGLDVYIDDNTEKLVPLVGVVPELFLFEWGYNEHELPPPEVQRVASWADFYAAVST